MSWTDHRGGRWDRSEIISGVKLCPIPTGRSRAGSARSESTHIACPSFTHSISGGPCRALDVPRGCIVELGPSAAERTHRRAGELSARSFVNRPAASWVQKCA